METYKKMLLNGEVIHQEFHDRELADSNSNRVPLRREEAPYTDCPVTQCREREKNAIK